MEKLWKENRGLFWLIVSIAMGIIWGLWKGNFWAGFFPATMFLVMTIFLELYRNQDKK